MKTKESMLEAFIRSVKSFKIGNPEKLAYTIGLREAQEFIPIEEEKPPYGEDILVQTHAGSIYFGKMRTSLNGCPDFLRPDLAGSERNIKIQQIKSWRPIFYK